MRPRRRVTDDAGDGLPSHLLAGRCVEVWSPDRGDWHEAWTRYGKARREWNAEHPDRPLVILDGQHAPWSYQYVRETRGEACLVEWLVSRGLPADWVPSPAPV